ncbi:oligosaccharide flippase family protein [Aquamicrobium ahrensii]|uniref:O-antigen/teichoic acid export membrane protein n=1 Tax=Aquamicrobium ahrensii TaxID=469551 RepID=A0ABV2KP98_9HYPH
MLPLRKLFTRSADLRTFGFGLIWSTLGTVAVRLTPLITTVLISHWFGIESVGKFAVTYGTLMSASMLAATGVSLMATRNIAAFAKTEPDTAGRLAGMAVLLAGGTGVALALAIYVFSDEIAGRILKQPGLAFYLRVISPIIAISALNNVQTAILRGLQEFRTTARLDMIMGILMIGSVPAGLYLYGLTGGFAALGFAYLAGCMITTPAMLHGLRSRGIRFSFSGSLSQWPMITRYAIPALLASLLYEPVNWICTTIIVNKPDGLEQVGLYFIAMQLETLLLFAPQIVVQVLIPMLSSGFGEKDSRRVRNILAMSIGANLAIAIGFVAVMMLFGDWFLLLFKLDPARDWPIFMIVVLAAAMIACALPLGQVPVSSGYMWTGLSITGGWAATFIIGTWLFQDQGAKGIVIARAIAWGLQTLVYIGFTHFAISRTTSHSKEASS